MSHVNHYKEDAAADCVDRATLVEQIRGWGEALGFQQIGISDIELAEPERRLQQWLDDDRHGDMEWMARHGTKRTRPSELVPGTRSVIVARMDYLPAKATPIEALLDQPHRAAISRYAIGRDYHKVLRARLQRLATLIGDRVGPFGYRVFTDSAPVMEKPLAVKAGLGWMGKHTNVLNRRAGSYFFLGVIYTDLDLPSDAPVQDHCGSCNKCIDVCPTQAITGPQQLDARRCISYLTIENKGSIPLEFRRAIGNRIYGCDDCQAVCP
ncbi:MAG: tRNA epoxyqueuosine(34) reductase QueG, partial [Pseudomonadota bacterium]